MREYPSIPPLDDKPPPYQALMPINVPQRIRPWYLYDLRERTWCQRHSQQATESRTRCLGTWTPSLKRSPWIITNPELGKSCWILEMTWSRSWSHMSDDKVIFFSVKHCQSVVWLTPTSLASSSHAYLIPLSIFTWSILTGEMGRLRCPLWCSLLRAVIISTGSVHTFTEGWNLWWCCRMRCSSWVSPLSVPIYSMTSSMLVEMASSLVTKRYRFITWGCPWALSEEVFHGTNDTWYY